MEDCTGIRNHIVQNAGFSGIQGTTSYINVWYDDGRAVANNQIGNTQTNVVGDCNGSNFAFHTTTYSCLDATSCPTRGTPPDLINGDRIVIDINVTVPFLTPVLKAFVPDGINMHLRNARSIFPDGLAS